MTTELDHYGASFVEPGTTRNKLEMKKKMHPFFASGLVAGGLALALVGVGAAHMIGRMAGADAGDRSRDRLQIIWPSIMTMQQDDRALIVGLAMSCHLEHRPTAANEVVACLREAAADPHAILPKGMDAAGARARLEQLLPHSGGERA